MLTFFLGFGEVAKNIYFIEQRRAHGGNPDALRFFIQAANWSGVVYPTLFLLAPAIFVEMSFPPIICSVYAFVLFWLALAPNQKTSRLALAMAFAVGYGTPIVFMISIGHVLEFQAPPITDQTPFQTLLALIALIGFMAGLLRLSKDLFGLNLAAFTRNIWNRQVYSNDSACLFLLLSVSLGMTIVLTCAWFVLFVFPGPLTQPIKVQYANRLVYSGVAVVVLAILAVVCTIFRPTKLSTIIAQSAEINSLAPPTSAQTAPAEFIGVGTSWLAYLLLAARSGRTGVSCIAGFAGAVAVYRSPAFSWESVISMIIAMTFVTMSGFIMNDIYDREKDKLADKRRPITTGALSVTGAWCAVGGLIGASLALTYASFGVGSVSILLGIAAALFVYSPVARRWPLIKGLYTAVLALSPFVFAYSAVEFVIPGGLALLLLVYIVFRESVLDALDSRGDMAAGVRTIAFYAGKQTVLMVGWIGMFIALIAAVILLDSRLSQIAISVGIIFQLIASGMFIFGIPYSLGVTRAALLSGVAAVALANG